MIIGYAIACRPARFARFQNDGEAELSRILQRIFNGPDYHLLNHITLDYRGGTTQIDHVLVSRFGVFVIETKAYNGWIFADAKHETWTQVFYRAKFRFQNPIRQNYGHVQAVRQVLDFLPPNAVESLVVFVGNPEFKTEKPEGVYFLPELIDYLQAQTEEVMSHNRLQFCVGRLETHRLALTHQTDVEHVESLQRRYN
ncbi:MAG: nuclease-related domain-containing protein [Candidatus Pacebacteria bacterium]|nr:nuclease-related domain-containing protein [Candidatus Paceibacterota bacterium]